MGMVCICVVDWLLVLVGFWEPWMTQKLKMEISLLCSLIITVL